MSKKEMTTICLPKKDLVSIVGNRSLFIREAIRAKLGICSWSLESLIEKKKKLKLELKLLNKEIKTKKESYDV